MKHRPIWRRVAEYVGCSLSARDLEILEGYMAWLEEEAVPAGALGPREGERLSRRHIADSLLFARPFPEKVAEIWDLGSGAGLPGIPLAVMLPQARVVLVERSGRRAVLLRRAVRLLGLENVEVWERDIDHLEGRSPTLVCRAGLPAAAASEVVRKLLLPGGIAVWGGSWVDNPEVSGWETVEIPAEILDHPVWLLIMRHP